MKKTTALALTFVIFTISMYAAVEEKNIKKTITYDSVYPVEKSTIKPQEALERLKQGNIRYQRGGKISMEFDRNRGGAQSPFAAVLSCADSRVTPESVFYVQSGQLFVTRVAGNIVNQELVGSLEFAVRVFGTALIVVLGHESCGAVDAALAGTPQPGAIQSILNAITPGIAGVNRKSPNARSEGVIANVRAQVRQLRANDTLKEFVGRGQLMIVGGVYNFRDGSVAWLE
ncbi:carbonic anhydrase [Candidatus Dependentiae bacterium Noda2021]|nr:carbonic anhydrase [Candidatus Dependentiae bacterium Noda2021]